MIPRLSIGFLIIVALAYIAGARWPSLAQRIGAA